jgi:hypothetical protein
MTIEQRKIALIKWITNLENESLLEQIEDFKSRTLDELPQEIIKLLTLSDGAKEVECIEHSTSKNLLSRK